MGRNPAFIDARRPRPSKHGHTAAHRRTPEYKTWAAMKRRCGAADANPSYGGRGITVCERWRSSFEDFLADMGARPAGHTIDRIDPNGNYEPGNCRWATAIEQASENRRDRAAFVVDGKNFATISAAARAYGIDAGLVRGRVRRGIPLLVALTAAVDRRAKMARPS